MNADPARPAPHAVASGAATDRSIDRSSNPCSATPARLLVVDDDPDVCRILCSALQMFNFQVDAARDGSMAWDALCSNSYDLVITDHMMPRLTGLELIRKLRTVRRDLPCILISGDLPDLESDLSSLLLPLLAVEKPVRLEKLIWMVRSLMAAHPVAHGECRHADHRLACLA